MSQAIIDASMLQPGDQYTSQQRDRRLTVREVQTIGDKLHIFHEEIAGTTKLFPWEQVHLHD